MTETVRELVNESCELLARCERAVDPRVLVELELLRAELRTALEDCLEDDAFQDGRALVLEITMVLARWEAAPQRLAS